MKTKSLVEMGYTNKVLMRKNFQINYLKFNQRVDKIRISNSITPLFQIALYEPRQKRFFQNSHNVYQICNHQISKQLKTQMDANKFDRILIIHSDIIANARRNVLINVKRDSLVQFMNRYGVKNKIYFIQMSKINLYIPDQELISLLNAVFQANNFNCITNTQSTKLNPQSIQLNVNQNIFQILFPFDLKRWQAYYKKRIDKKYVKFSTFKDSLLQLQLYNAYKIKFSKNRQLLYEDIKDLRKMVVKFNFFRYFCIIDNNQGKCLKNCEKLIKSIQWRTQQTEEYLLFLIRNQPWQRLSMVIDNFIDLFQNKFNIKQQDQIAKQSKPQTDSIKKQEQQTNSIKN